MADDIKWALDEFKRLANRYTIARDYYNGDHRLAFASEKFKTTFGSLFSAFADNLMPVIVETPRDRLKLSSFSSDEKAQEKITEIWRRNRMVKRAGDVHLDAFIEGDSYIIVWPDAEGNPVFYPNRAPRIVIEYDDEQPGYIVKAAKAWITSDKYARLTLYYPDRIEKYITRSRVQGGLPSTAKAFIQYEAENEPWPLDNPYLKVPVFHFGNRTSIGQLGRSELAEGIPLQDALNKTVCDMLVGSEFHGLPQRWAVGLDEAEEAEARERYKLMAGGVWGATSKDVKFGEFQTGDLRQFVEVINDFRKEIARVSRTPLHYFTMEGNMPSGESMKTADAPLLAKVEDRQAAWGMVWSDVMRFALQIQGIDDAQPEPIWTDTTPRNQLQELENAVKKAKELRIPLRIVLKEVGYTDKEIDSMKIPEIIEAEEEAA